MASFTFVSAHGSVVPYPVAPVGSEQIVRDILTRLDAIRVQMQVNAPLTGGVLKVDEITLAPSGRGGAKTLDKFQSLLMQRAQAREDLGDALGCGNFRRGTSRSTTVSIY